MNAHAIRRILVPTDMSDFATLALHYALLLQKKVGAEITLLYAEEFEFLLTAEYPLCFYFDNTTAAKAHAHELLRNYSKRMAPDAKGIRTLIVDSTPARAIVNTAEDINADLIIMGTHGRHGLRGTLLGSVTERVLRETGRPLLTVIPQQFPVNANVDIRRVLCPVNFTEVARHALQYACGFAELFGAELVVMNVVEVPEAAGAEKRFMDWVDPLLRDHTRYQQLLVSGDPAERVLETANEIGADLIVLGAQHTRFSDASVIGTTTERITRFARQPILTVMRHAELTKQREVQEELRPAAV